MEPLHYKLWDRCTALVARACAGRDASHGLAHMRKVTEQAVLLYLMGTNATTTPAVRAGMLYRAILVGMLHDVADHKYDHDGTLFAQVEAFVEAEAATLFELIHDAKHHASFYVPLACRVSEGGAAVQDGAAEVKRLLLTSLDAISYSKENKRGMRWFVPALSCEAPDTTSPPGPVAPSDVLASTGSWVAVRDYVSDADKLEAIGEEGLLRCYEYTCERYRDAARKTAKAAADHNVGNDTSAAAATRLERHVEQLMLADVVGHFHEKLKRLLPEFIVTPTGKYLGSPRAAEMAALLKEWEAHGPPPVTVYWRTVAEDYAMQE